MNPEERRETRLAKYPITRDEYGQYWIWHDGERISVHHGRQQAELARERIVFPIDPRREQS